MLQLRDPKLAGHTSWQGKHIRVDHAINKNCLESRLQQVERKKNILAEQHLFLYTVQSSYCIYSTRIRKMIV
jgi:hypothetical protein